MEAIVETPPEPEIKPKTFWDLLKSIFIIYGKGFLKFIIPMVIFVAAMNGIFLLAFFKLPKYGVPGFGVALAIMTVYVIMYMLASVLIIQTAASYNLKGKSSLKASIIIAWRRLPKLLGLLVLIWSLSFILFIACWFLFMMYIIGLIIFIVIVCPIAIYLMVKWNFILPSLVLENRGSEDSFKRSSGLVEGHWWRTFGIILVIGIIAGGIGYGLEYAFGLIQFYFRGSGILLSLSPIGTILSVPIGIIGNTLLYYNLRARNEHCSIKEAIAELDPSIKKPVDSTPTPTS